MSSVLGIAAVELRRFLRDRSNIFFVFIFPLLLVLVIGLQFGEGAATGRVAVAGPDSTLRSELVQELEDAEVSVTLAGWDEVREQLARGRLDVGLRLDDAAATAYESGQDVRLEMVPGSQARSQLVQQQVRTAVEALRTEQGQVAALTGRGIGSEQARAALAAAADGGSPPELVVTSLNRVDQQFAGMERFDLGASGQLMLFVFLASLAGSSTLIQARRIGVVTRTLAAPISTAQLIGGETLGRLAIALFQGGYIMAATALLFGVGWGNLGLSLLVLLLFSLVSAGAAMLVGAVLDNEGAAVGVGVGLGLVLAALGGSMFPLELFPDAMRTVSRVTPHSWGYEAFAEIQRRGGTLVDILPQLAVLLGMAVVLLLLGAWALRRSLSRAM